MRALAIAGDIDYREAHVLYEFAGRPAGQPYYLSRGIKVFANRYHAYCPPIPNAINPSVGMGYTPFYPYQITLEEFVNRYPTGRFVVGVLAESSNIGHAFALINGVIYDTNIPSPWDRVNEAWQIERTF